MKAWNVSLLPFLLMIATISCAESGEEEGAAIAGTADVEAAIDSLNDRFEQSLLAGDTIALGDLYAEDAVALPPNAPRVEGKAGIRSFWGGVVASTPVTSVSLDTDTIVVAESGELAYEVGRYSLGGSTLDGQSWEDMGKYLVVWRKVGTEWKLAADMWSSDQPAGAAPADTSGSET